MAPSKLAWVEIYRPERLKTNPSVDDRQPHLPGEILSVEGKLVSYRRVPDVEVYDLGRPRVMIPGAADLAHLYPLPPQDLEPDRPDPVQLEDHRDLNFLFTLNGMNNRHDTRDTT